MAPNNALMDRTKKVTKPASNNDSSNANKEKNQQGTTTVLESGTVEARGMGISTSGNGDVSRTQVHKQIRDFLQGEGKFSGRTEFRAFFTVFTFITRLPGPTWVDHHPGYLMRGMAYFPLAGLLVGIFVGVFFDLGHVVFHLPTIVAATLSTGASLWVTGCFHEDGLADSSDGIGGGWSRQQILTIMTDTRLGTYGCAVLLLYIVAKLELLAALGTSHWHCGSVLASEEVATMSFGAGPALIVAHTVARFTAPYMVHTYDYVDENGPKYKFYSFMVQAKYLVSKERVLFAMVTSFAAAAILYGVLLAVLLLAATLVFAHCAGNYGDYLLGGVMGDFLGATICMAELLILGILLSVQNMMVKEDNLMLAVTADKAMQYITDLIEGWKESCSTLQPEDFISVLTDTQEPLSVALRFGIVILVTIVWSKNVGHPPVLVRETVVKTQQEDMANGNDTIRVSLPSNAQESNGSVENHPTGDANTAFEERYKAAEEYLDSLAKPVGSLGTLEAWAARLAALTKKPLHEAVCLIFAADHGVAKAPSEGGEGCSAFPQVVTQSVVKGLSRNVAGASVLAKQNNVTVRVIDVGVTDSKYNDDMIVQSAANKLEGGTQNFCKQAAMTLDETNRCVQMGRDELMRFCSGQGASHMVALGEVGIGNTTASSALIAALTGAEPKIVCGGGATTGRTPDPQVIAKKVDIVRRALKKHAAPIQRFHKKVKDKKRPFDCKAEVMEILSALGGAEIAALVGAILEASNQEQKQQGASAIPIIVDGFIVTTAALVAAYIQPQACRIMFMATQSAEPGHAKAIESIQAVARQNKILPPESPVLDMGLRLGEGSGAILAIPLLRSASAVMSNMTTLKEILES